MPPLYCRLTTMGLKVARPWAGIVGGVPHGAAHSRGRGAGVFMRRFTGGVFTMQKLWRVKRAAWMIWENCGSNFDLSISTLGNDFSKNDCIKAKLTADMTAIYFGSYSHYRILSHPIAQGLDVSPYGIIRYSHGCTLWNTMAQDVALSPVIRGFLSHITTVRRHGQRRTVFPLFKSYFILYSTIDFFCKFHRP
jgi:hypothetical protein